MPSKERSDNESDGNKSGANPPKSKRPRSNNNVTSTSPTSSSGSPTQKSSEAGGKAGEEKWHTPQQMQKSPRHESARSDGGGKPEASNRTHNKSDTKNTQYSTNLTTTIGAGPPLITAGTVDLPLGPALTHLTCSLCHGIYRNPHTIADCLHTFCKACLYRRFAERNNYCPTCNINLNPDPYRECHADRTMESVVDKLFPQLREQDVAEEKMFYKEKGIRLKQEFAGEGGYESEEDAADDAGRKTRNGTAGKRPSSPAKTIPPAGYDGEIDFHLFPDDAVGDEYVMPKLTMTALRASGHLKVASLKKFLCLKLDLSRKGQPKGTVPASAIEICCNDTPVGDELSLIFIQRTRWIQVGEDMELTYRFKEEGILG